MKAVAVCAAESIKSRTSLLESTQAVSAHQATFLEHFNQVEKYAQRLLARSEMTGALMKQFPSFDKWRIKWQTQHVELAAQRVELLFRLEALKK